MTVLVGVRCTDGIVIGADSVATSSMGPNPLVQLPSNSKIEIVKDTVIVAATGAVGLAQRLMHHVDQAITGNCFKNLNRAECTTNITKRFLTDCHNTMVPMHPQLGYRFGALLAAVIKGEPCLVEYASTDFQPEVKLGKLFYVTMGSGQQLADPFLAFVSRVLWGGNTPTVEDAKLGVSWVLNHTIHFAPGGVGGPINLATLRQVNGNWVAETSRDTEEQAQYMSELEGHIAGFARSSIAEADSNPLPQPPPG